MANGDNLHAQIFFISFSAVIHSMIQILFTKLIGTNMTRLDPLTLS